MASFNPQDHGFGFEEPPPRPTTPPVRRGFLLVLFVLCIAALDRLRSALCGRPHRLRVGSGAGPGRHGGPGEARQGRRDQPSLGPLPAGGDRRVSGRRQRPVATRSPRRRGDARDCPSAATRWPRVSRARELGSGVIIDKAKGYVVTNYHVVKEADRIMVRLGPGRRRPRPAGGSRSQDRPGRPAGSSSSVKVQAEWGDSDQLDIGDWVLAIGSPLGFDHSVTAGIVSATERNDVKIAEYESFIQTDAAINPGNSGGPLINLAGKVVGINTAIITQTGGYEGIGLAIPSSLAKRVVEGLIKEGKVVRGYLGVRIQPLTADDRQGAQAARIITAPWSLGVLPGSPADDERPEEGRRDRAAGRPGRRRPAELRILTANLDVGAQVPVVYSQGRGHPDGDREDRRASGLARSRDPRLPRAGSHPSRRGKGRSSRSIGSSRKARRPRPGFAPG